jgi:hypothetical protein
MRDGTTEDVRTYAMVILAHRALRRVRRENRADVLASLAWLMEIEPLEIAEASRNTSH